MVRETGVPLTTEQQRLVKVQKHLAEPTRNLQEILGKSREILSARLSSVIASEATIQPTISASERWIILPKTFQEEDYYVGWYMTGVAQLLGLKVYLVEYTGDRRKESADDAERLSMGFLCALEDLNRNLRIKHKGKDLVEQGRTIVRAQQIVRLFTSENLGHEALRKDHYFFGNNPGEKEVVDKLEMNVRYSAKLLDSCFKEVAWAERLRQLLITLMRESARLLSPETVTHAVETNLLTREDVILQYCSSVTTVTHGKGKKRRTEKVRETPKRPKPSSLLLPTEQKFIDSIAKNIFTEASEDELRHWPKYISDHGFGPVRDELRANYTLRRLFRQAFGRITTSRLKEIRKLIPETKFKKKKDLSGVDLTSLIGSRADRDGVFATEVAILDPHFSTALLYYRTEVTHGNRRALDVPGSILKLKEDIVRLGVYSNEDKMDDMLMFQSHPPVKQLPTLKLPPSKQGLQNPVAPVLDEKPPDSETRARPVERQQDPSLSRASSVSSEDERKEPSTFGGDPPTRPIVKNLSFEFEKSKLKQKDTVSRWLSDVLPYNKFTWSVDGMAYTFANISAIEAGLKVFIPLHWSRLPVDGSEWNKERGFKVWSTTKLECVLKSIKKGHPYGKAEKGSIVEVIQEISSLVPHYVE